MKEQSHQPSQVTKTPRVSDIRSSHRFVTNTGLPEQRKAQEAMAHLASIVESSFSVSACRRGLRIAVDDDDPDTLKTIRVDLESLGADVKACSSTAEATGVLVAGRVLSDIAMPDEDGYALIKRSERLRPVVGGRIPVVCRRTISQSRL